MKNKADVRSLGFLVIALIFQLTVVLLPFESHNFGTLCFLFILNIVLVFQTALINHNHRHHEIFYSSSLNRILDQIISIILLSPSTRLHAVHLLNHHANFKNGKDWASYKLIRKNKSGLFRSLEYLKTSSFEMFKNRPSLNLSAELTNRRKHERVLILFYGFTLIVLNPILFFLWLLPSCIIGLFALLLANLINHDHCDLTSDYNHSRNFCSQFENWFFCNNGYHTAHHLKPSLHWSQYPHFHQHEVLGKIDPKLNEGSLLFYSLKHYALFK